MGAINDALANVTDPAERRRIKAEAMASLASLAGRTAVKGAFTLTISSGPRLVRVNGEPAVELSVTVKRTTTGKIVTPPLLNPIRIFNPPILVDDPAGDIVRTWTDEDGIVRTRRMREDLVACILATLRDLAKA